MPGSNTVEFGGKLLDRLLAQEEGKTLEFKENAKSLQGIVKTAIAFANTAGGTIVIGVRDKTKEVVGLEDILEDETRIANAIASNVEPLLRPSIEMVTWRKRDLLIIDVAHSIGPYYLKKKGEQGGTYVRFGSTNRAADRASIEDIRRLASNRSYDGLPKIGSQLQDLDWELARRLFEEHGRSLTKTAARSMGVLCEYQGQLIPSNGGFLLFGKDPGVEVRCACFEGEDTETAIDMQDFQEPLPLFVDRVMHFIRRHTRVLTEMKDVRRKDIPEYPLAAVREAIVNALVHANYEEGAPIRIAVFRNRIEITNPGCLPYGLSLARALSGMSKLRNKVLGHVFRMLGLIEEWGFGLQRIQRACEAYGGPPPTFAELDNFFRVVLFGREAPKVELKAWEEALLDHLRREERVSHKEAAKLWKMADRTARQRLKTMVAAGLVVAVGTSRYDPNKVYVLPSAPDC